MRVLSSILVFGLALWMAGCGDDSDSSSTGGGGGDTDTITLTGTCIDWLRTEPFPFSGANVCVHNADPANCAEIDGQGNFVLSGLAKESAINLTMEGVACFLHLSRWYGSEDSVELRWLQKRPRPSWWFPGVDSVDDTKGHRRSTLPLGFEPRGCWCCVRRL